MLYLLQLFEGKISYSELCNIDYYLLQNMQEIKEKEIEKKVKEAKKMQSEKVKEDNMLVNKANTINNSEKKQRKRRR